MNIVFIDLENVGGHYLENTFFPSTDKVLVFTRLEKHIAQCEKLMYVPMYSYEQGKNQADFYMISSLSRTLALATEEHIKELTIECHTNDTHLIEAFKLNCEMYNVTLFVAKRPKKEASNDPDSFSVKSIPALAEQPESIRKLAYRILELLGTPSTFNQKFYAKLGVSQSDFCKSTHALIQANVIKRNNEGRWTIAS